MDEQHPRTVEFMGIWDALQRAADVFGANGYAPQRVVLGERDMRELENYARSELVIASPHRNGLPAVVQVVNLRGAWVAVARGDFGRMECDDHGGVLALWLITRGNAGALFPWPTDRFMVLRVHLGSPCGPRLSNRTGCPCAQASVGAWHPAPPTTGIAGVGV